jgi:adenylate cyclase
LKQPFGSTHTKLETRNLTQPSDFALVLARGACVMLDHTVESQTPSPVPQNAAWLETANGVRTAIHGVCFLGRSDTNNVVLPDDRVSRRHAMIQTQGQEEFWLIDLGSSNGTYLNGRRITQPRPLTDKDRVEVGDHAFTFRHPKMVRPSETPQAGSEKTIQDIKTVPCWLLVADIESSTQILTALPADDGLRITANWLAACKQIIDDNAGAINKFLGDGFFAYWPERSNVVTSVARALQSLKKLQAVAQPRFRVVVHCGKVFVGGGASLGEESLMGNEVHTVFRMEKLARSLGCSNLVSEAANAQIQPHLPTHDEGRHTLQGFDGDFLFYSF